MGGDLDVDDENCVARRMIRSALEEPSDECGVVVNRTSKVWYDEAGASFIEVEAVTRHCEQKYH